MNANRVTGPGSPDSNKPADQKIQREMTQRVEKVREVDPDEQARQQRFKQMMQSETEEEVSSQPTAPSPFDTAFHLSSNQNVSDFDMESIPSPSYSQPPSLSPSSNDTLSDEDLPQSDQFWNHVDLPDQPIEKPQLKEKSAGKNESVFDISEQRKKSGKQQIKTEGKQPKIVEPSPFGPPGKSTLKKEGTPHKKSATEDDSTPSGKYWTAEGDSPTTFPSSISTKPSSKDKSTLRSKNEPLKGKTSPDELLPPVKGFTSAMDDASVRAEENERSEGVSRKQRKIVDIVSPSLPELPQNIQPMAASAATNAAPYLRPETMPLFFQMVGSILVMSTPPGISRTEIILNNPSFANSKFFGSTIEIIKYSTAPDSFNIRFTGSNEAVATFNANIPSLMAAFQTGHFNFRIGRINAEYTIDKPVLRRKESKDDGSAGGQQQEKGR